MASKQQIEARRQRNRDLAAEDAAHRCLQCKRNLAEAAQIVEDFLLDGKFCSESCLDAYRERTA